MEIERLGENKIRCALSEEEIREMGYNIDEIIGNTEVTQEFMRAVVELVEEQGNISMQNISPVVKAELLQDHSMAITFGGDSEMSFKNLVDTPHGQWRLRWRRSYAPFPSPARRCDAVPWRSSGLSARPRSGEGHPVFPG